MASATALLTLLFPLFDFCLCLYCYHAKGRPASNNWDWVRSPPQKHCTGVNSLASLDFWSYHYCFGLVEIFSLYLVSFRKVQIDRPDGVWWELVR